MMNPYEHLRQQTQGILPEPWESYPVIRNYESVTICNERDEYICLFVGIQDGYYVVGVDWNRGTSRSTFLPGRKWGQFVKKNDAILWGLGFLLSKKDDISNNAFSKISTKISEITQLSLF